MNNTNEQSIPLIFHQTWKTARLPRRLQHLRQTWIKHHPDAEHKLWTDEDNRNFLEEHCAWFLPIYDAYPEVIMQVDATRYFLLKHFGGIYVDLDFECLVPITPFLQNKQVIISHEPPSHFEALPAEIKSTLPGKLLCNAFMASVAGHPFWDHTIKLLSENHSSNNVLEHTGPVFLSRSYQSYTQKDCIHIEPYSSFYPVDKNEIRAPTSEQPLHTALAVHHWQGSWWHEQHSFTAYRKKLISEMNIMRRNLKLTRLPYLLKRYARLAFTLLRPSAAWRYLMYWSFSIPTPLQIDRETEGRQQLVWVKKLVRGKCISHTAVDQNAAEQILPSDKLPKISCLMVTRNRYVSGQRAVRCFLNQTYPNKELIIIDDGPDERLANWVDALGNHQLVQIRLPDEGKPLGELRNLSVKHASGQYVAQWDDDDIIHPNRLLMQMTMMNALDVNVSFLNRQLIWIPEQKNLGISDYRLLENTLICKKELLPDYPETLQKGEDTPVCEKLVRSSEIILCDQPDAYIYVVHDDNTWDQEHFEQQWENCLHHYSNDHYRRKLRQLSDDYGIVLADENDEVPASKPAPATARCEELPTMLVLTPAKNAAKHVSRFIDNLAATQYPPEKISLAFLESNSDDGTYETLEKELPQLRQRYARAELYKRDFDHHTKGVRWTVKQRQRRSILAKSRNMLLFNALRNEEWVMWIDIDLEQWPVDAFMRLLHSSKDIVVPHCIKSDGKTFDLNTFKLSEGAADLDWQRYLIDELLQPPVGYGRYYLNHFSDQEFVELDGVGATMLLIKADLHREGLIFPPQPYRHYIETEGLAQMAIDMGYTCWGMPQLTIIHVNE